MLSLSKTTGRLLIVLLALGLCSCPVFARSKNRSAVHQGTDQLEAALQSNDVESAQALATIIYQQNAAVAAPQPADAGIIIDPAMVADSTKHQRRKAAYEIAECFFRHAELELARQWATTAITGGDLSDPYVRRATVVLGNIAAAMDKDDEAAARYVSVITLKNRYSEQPTAYAGLLELLMLQKHDDLVEQWVRHGQARFEGAGELELEFLKKAAQTLQRRNHPLWVELDQQIVTLASDGKDKLAALRGLASNARKFGRYAEAETHYVAICELPLKSAGDTVNSYLFLADCQAKQGKSFATTIQRLQQKSTGFPEPVDKEYATYRTAEFYEDRGDNHFAEAEYSILANSASTSTWASASLNRLAALKEKEGDLSKALQLYLQYPQRFPQNQRFAVQAEGSALNVAETLGDTKTAGQIVEAITNQVALIQDYNVQLNLAHYFQKRGNDPLARSFLERGVQLAQGALNLATQPHQRYVIHYRILRRLYEFSQYQRALDHFEANASDFPADGDASTDSFKFQCCLFKTYVLEGMGQHQDAVTQLRDLLDQAQGNPDLETLSSEILGLFYGWSDDSAAAAQLFESAVQNNPTHTWANVGRLEMAVRKFNAADFAGARKLTEDIISMLPENAKMTWIREIYWSAVYLRGRCLEAQGETQEGMRLKQLATNQFPAGLNVQNRLH